MRTILIAALFSLAGLAGCLSDGDGSMDDPNIPNDPVSTHGGVVDLIALVQDWDPADDIGMRFEESVVDAAVSVTNDLYEPTMDVCDDGSIYITGHTILVDTTGAPVYGSHDDGATWEQLPWFQEMRMPGDVHGATPPPSDEIFLSCGDNGWLYGVDITLATFPVNGWSRYGQHHTYHNPNAYDEYQAVLQANECAIAPIKDRPWGSYANGKLLLVNNDGAGPAQIGVIDVPPLGITDEMAEVAPEGPDVPDFHISAGVGATTGFGRWNMCAGPNYAPTTNSIEGISDMYTTLDFAVPQRSNGQLYVTLGNAANIFELDIKPVFRHSTGGEITSVYGQAAYDKLGNLYVGITNNTAQDPDDNNNRTGRLRFAVSSDGGETFQDRIFEMEKWGPGIRHFYMDGNKAGVGALAVWAVNGDVPEEGSPLRYDWYAGHLFIGDDGAPELRNVHLIIDEGKPPSAHVTGASVGPDGRGYTAMYEGQGQGGTPISVFIQRAGPTMPIVEDDII